MTPSPDELIETRLSDLAGTVGSAIDTTVLTRRSTIQCHLEANWLTVLRRTNDHVQIARVEAKHNFTGRRLQHSAFSADVPRPAQTPFIQRWSRGRAISFS